MALDVGQLLAGLRFHLTGDPLPPRVGEIRSHSARVEPGDLFVAIPGRRHDGAAFAGEALRRGARVVMAQQPPAQTLPPGVSWLEVPCARSALSRLAANRYGHPSRQLVVVGVTGTTGKTTTTLLLYHLLSAAGIPTGLIGSLEVRAGGHRGPGNLTTPDPLDLHRYLRAMVDAGCRVAVMEVSSQGVDQRRVDDVAFDLGVVTNLAPLEHLEYHPTYEHYAAAKGRFVAMVPPDGGMLMHEGEAALRLGPYAQAPVVLFGRGPESALRLMEERVAAADSPFPSQGPSALWTNRLRLRLPSAWPPGPTGRLGQVLTGLVPWPAGWLHAADGHSVASDLEVWLKTQMLGPHHALNAVAAVGAALWLGLGLALVARALSSFAAPRRRTQVLMRQPFTVIDDTVGRPDSLAACFAVAAQIPHRRMAVVYAVRGGRGEAINYANGLQLACEARRFKATVVVTASAGDTSARDMVRPAEWEACLAGLKAGGLERPQVSTFARLGDAVAAAVSRLGEGDLLLLLGAQGMDAGAFYLKQILKETRRVSWAGPAQPSGSSQDGLGSAARAGAPVVTHPAANHARSDRLPAPLTAAGAVAGSAGALGIRSFDPVRPVLTPEPLAAHRLETRPECGADVPISPSLPSPTRSGTAAGEPGGLSPPGGGL
ncbi:Mur ligase family protein [Thermaerobacter sp. PB12/4term]|uniref:Mur ligase family protein n=1 Tax=Thermaerobacter sp. PB12/4term TaxID=2293838 RepID=UPI001FAB591D|nr:Mur ligase family protein [Thermaerobacter sp. PB12/4term]